MEKPWLETDSPDRLYHACRAFCAAINLVLALVGPVVFHYTSQPLVYIKHRSRVPALLFLLSLFYFAALARMVIRPGRRSRPARCMLSPSTPKSSLP